jgi:peroxiredoxin
MRIQRSGIGHLLLFAMVATSWGCSQPWGLRGSSDSQVRTVASVGDQALPIRAGTPESSIRAEIPAPRTSDRASVRISGRVFDERGRPVPDARVRLAVNGSAAGKATIATTDRSGAFTIRGVRPGSSYTVIAESVTPQGKLVGRAEALAPEVDLRIGLLPEPTNATDRPASILPARPRVSPISQAEDEELSRIDQPTEGPRLNDEDVTPLEEENLPSLGMTPRSSGWSKVRSPALDPRSQRDAGPPAPGYEEVSEPDNPTRQDQEVDLEEINPLPPARESSDPGRQSATKARPYSPSRRASVQRMPPHDEIQEPRDRIAAISPARQVSRGRQPTPYRANPSDRFPRNPSSGIQKTGPKRYAPFDFGDRDDTPSKPQAKQPQAQESREEEAEPEGPTSSPTQARRPTWGDLSLSRRPIPLDEALRQASLSRKETSPPGVIAHSVDSGQTVPPHQLSGSPNQIPGPPARPLITLHGKNGVSCQLEPSEQRVVDFQLPDVTGRMIRLQDFNAELILLNFWGTWCEPCQLSTAHLIELQSKLGTTSLQVIGIACEAKGEKHPERTVARVVRDSGINYPVLLSSKDDPCPVKEAFQVQFYPTMVLIDRSGKILERQQGATEITLSRLDRQIARSLDPSTAARAMARERPGRSRPSDH